MKKQKTIIIFLLLVILVMLGALLYIVYSRGTEEAENNEVKTEVKEETNAFIIPDSITLTESSQAVLEKYGMLLKNGKNMGLIEDPINRSGSFDQIYFLNNFNKIYGTEDEQSEFINFYLFSKLINIIDTITYGDSIQYTDPAISKCVGDVICKHVDVNKVKELIYDMFGIENFDINHIIKDGPLSGIFIENDEYYINVHYDGVAGPMTNYYLSEKKVEDKTEIVCLIADSDMGNNSIKDGKITLNEYSKYKIIIDDSHILEINKID